MRIAIIGAGVSGIAAGGVLKRCGHAITLFDKADRPGGIWVTAYPGVSLQNTWRQYHFADLPWPTPPDLHPTREQILDYLVYAVREFTLDVRFGTHVERMEERANAWVLNVDCAGRREALEFDFVIIAIGQYAEGKNRPRFPGEETFAGRILTERDIADHDIFTDREIAVFGFGKSALDMAAMSAKRARRVHHVFRQARWAIPFRMLGIHFTTLMFCRASTAMMPSWAHGNRAERFLHRHLGALVKVFWRLIEMLFLIQIRVPGWRHGSAARERLRQVRPTHRLVPDLRSALALAPPGYYATVGSGRIVPHISDLAAFDERGVRLTDDSHVACDLVVLSLGSLTPAFPFLPAKYRAMLEQESDGPQLYRHLIEPRIPRVAFAGYNHGFMHMPAAEVGALWLAALLDGEMRLPGPAQMQSAIEHVREWKRAHIHFEPSRSCAVNTRFQQYLDLLLTDLGFSPYRKLPNVLAEVFVQYGARDYRGLVAAYLARRDTRPELRMPSEIAT